MSKCSVCQTDIIPFGPIQPHRHNVDKYIAICYPDGKTSVAFAWFRPAILMLSDIDHLDEERIERLLALA